MLLTKDTDHAITTLKSGGVIVYPTETSYGLGCDATNTDAVARIFAMKGRPENKGVTVLLPEDYEGKDFGIVWSDAAKALAKKFLPGALNIILSVRSTTPLAHRCLTNNTIAVRRSSHPIATALVDALSVPLVSTSANISGEPDSYSAEDIYKRFLQQTLRPDCIIDAGKIPKHAPSTLVQIADDGAIVVLRQGEIVI